MTTGGGRRTSTVSVDQLQALMEHRIGLIERCQLQGGTDEFMKNNMPFLLPLAEHTKRIKWKSLHDVAMQ
eukprot:5543513-Pyramimonas_sp.AAC.1